MKVINIKKNYGERKILAGVSFEGEEGKVTVILGESGCGKSTLLGILSNNIKDFSGEIVFDRDISSGISYIFQEDTLIPWKTVYENIEYVLKDKISASEMRTYIEKYLKMVNLLEYKDEYPEHLSGGMKRRVGIARAFAYPSDYLFMDEPFEFLDIKTKGEIIEYFKLLQEENKKTVLFITHDIESALKIGDKIVVFSSKPTRVKRVFDTVTNNEKLSDEIRKILL
ncbi:MAG: ATP-binding cassette domain-containing protein [Candidatus Fusobacterium pullicola]|uniref:ATP-binding cassette domain-containing protein n=1 Tax=Candidatus Fusobacterium pullicola TaxID=2838601 RepID=A0A9E2NWF6_9FUSO|nr:ATP-binding cassette domain-containing protein [Candidatus Fusobacterium pullicola]